MLQLGGNDWTSLAAATTAARQRGGFFEINLNCGCPSITTGGADFGASLMRDAQHTRSLVESMIDASAGEMSVSVKCRIGVHETLRPDGSVPDDAYETLAHFVDEAVLNAGASHLVVHARAAVLGGLSPIKNRVIPPLRHEYVARLAADFPSLRVTLNGGLTLDHELWPLSEACNAATGSSSSGGGAGGGDGRVNGVMIGRSVLRSPLDLWHMDGLWHSDGLRHTDGLRHMKGATRRGARAPSRAAAIERYTRYACDALSGGGGGGGRGGGAHVADVLAPIVLVAQQLHEANGCAMRGMGADERRDVFHALCEATDAVLTEAQPGRRRSSASLDVGSEQRDGEHGDGDGEAGCTLPTRALLKQLAKGVGKKEASKLERNRREALTA